jgi:hypothetical protein
MVLLSELSIVINYLSICAIPMQSGGGELCMWAKRLTARNFGIFWDGSGFRGTRDCQKRASR